MSHRTARRPSLRQGLVLCGLAAALAYPAIALYGAHRATRLRPRPVGIAPESIAGEWEAVTFPARGDRLALRGWWFPNGAARRALVLLHGRGHNRYDRNWQSDAIARALLRRGYAVLLFDLRGHGESPRARLSYGVREAADVLGALDFLRERGYADEAVAMLGSSYGAAAMLMALPELSQVAGLVADSTYAELWPVVAAEIPRQSPRLARLRPGPGMRLAARLLFRIDLAAARPIAPLAAAATPPILFIHGAADAYVPPAHSERLHGAASHQASELWLVPDAGHALTYTAAPETWLERVTTFLDRCFMAASRRG
ncbi:MAG TPA: alpha/beta fold hydrolase [Dehalococcoidia bacterium]|nr:alpha/beta fold hydrolase [Dehalococcoidia bacterium]